MELGVILCTVIVWVVFFVCLKLLEHSFQESLYRILDKLNLSVSLGHIRWRTTYFNHAILNLGGKYKEFWKIWFNFGVYFGVFCMISSVVLLCTNLLWMFRSIWLIYTTEEGLTDQPTMMITPVIPGVNVHGSQLLYLFLSLFISGILHELGHAIAAVCERVKVNYFGLFVTILYPGAFVDLGEEMLNRITPIQQLRIFCAGSWHNLTLALFSLALMFTVQFWISPLYVYSSQGPYIVGVFDHSPFGGISKGDIILGIDNCTTRNVRDLQECLFQIATRTNVSQTGYLIDDFLSSLSESSDNNSRERPICCDHDYTGSLQCFSNTESGFQKFQCLSARSVISNYPECGDEIDSENCLYPVLPEGQFLLRLYVKSKYREKEMHLFAGTPENLWYSFIARDYQIRWNFLSLLPIDLPFYITTLLYYISSISAGLAILNLAPVFFLDGKWALKQFLHYLFPSFHEKATWIILSCSTTVFVFNLVLSIGMLLYNKDPLIF